jgi:hypothetical protein
VKTDERFERWHKCSGGDERIRCHYGDGLSPNHHSELCTEKNKIRTLKGLSNSKNLVFNVKKLLNIGVNLMLW